jgi:hypothetical protein
MLKREAVSCCEVLKMSDLVVSMFTAGAEEVKVLWMTTWVRCDV